MMKLFSSPRLLAAAAPPMRLAKVRDKLGFGPLCAKPLDPDLTWRWIEPAVLNRGIRHDTARFAAGMLAQQHELADATEQLHRFDRPVLVAWGTKDRFFRIAEGRELANRFPDNRVVEIADSRTFVAHDQPARLAEEIARFVEQTGSAQTAGQMGKQRSDNPPKA